MGEQKTIGLGTGVLPPPSPLPLSEKLRVSSRIVQVTGARNRGSTGPVPFGWLGQGIAGLMSPSLLHEAHRVQKATKQDPPAGDDPRSSREAIEDYGRRAGARGSGSPATTSSRPSI